MGSESLNWRSAESEMPPPDSNTDPVRSQTHSASQVATAGTSVGTSKVENVAEHQDYVAYLLSGKIMMIHDYGKF